MDGFRVETIIHGGAHGYPWEFPILQTHHRTCHFFRTTENILKRVPARSPSLCEPRCGGLKISGTQVYVGRLTVISVHQM
jgi:hypothetical protein